MCNGVAVRTNQNLICDHLLPKRDLLLQTQLVNDVQRLEKPSKPKKKPPPFNTMDLILTFKSAVVQSMVFLLYYQVIIALVWDWCEERVAPAMR